MKKKEKKTIDPTQNSKNNLNPIYVDNQFYVSIVQSSSMSSGRS